MEAMSGAEIRALTVQQRADTWGDPEFRMAAHERALRVVAEEGRYCGDCYVVDRAHNRGGYPVIKLDYNQITIVQAIALPPPGFVSRHLCGNSACVNPNHISPGTQQENADDRKRHRTNAHGEGSGKEILTEDNVRAIRRAPMSDTDEVLADRFGASIGAVRKARTGGTWPHLNVEVPPRIARVRLPFVETRGGVGTDAEIEIWTNQGMQQAFDYIAAFGVAQANGCILNPTVKHPPSIYIHGRKFRISVLLADAERTQPTCGNRLCINSAHWPSIPDADDEE